MSEGKMQQWVRQLKDGQKNMHDEDRGGQPSTMQDDFVEKVYNKIVKICGSQFQSYQCVFHKFHIHYSMKVAEVMHYHKVCARWVPKVLTEGGNAAYNISLNVPSAVEQRRAEIPGSHCDW